MADFIEAVARATGASPLTVAFFVGGLVISLAVAIVGRIARMRGQWRRQVEARDRTQSATTTQTPRQVMDAGRRAQRSLTYNTLLIVLISIVALGSFALWQLGRLDEVLTWAGRSLEGWLAP